MLARRPMPPEYAAWNRAQFAPVGDQRFFARQVAARLPKLERRFPRVRGPFAIQPNNSTRVFEYPWAYYATPLGPGMRAVEIGGGLAGFQFVLASEGLEVINVDPGIDASGVGWTCDPDNMARLNRAFRTSVDLRNTTLDRAAIADESVDRIYSISTIEHIPLDEIPLLAAEMRRILKPGGQIVLTIDLFLDLVPFTAIDRNRYGWNINVQDLVHSLDLEVDVGEPHELYGYQEFDAQWVLTNLGSLVYGSDYPTCVQLVVLRKPDRSSSNQTRTDGARP